MSSSNDSTSRLYELKLAQVEVATKYCQLSADEPARLEAILKKERDNYLHLKQMKDNCQKDRVSLKKSSLKDERESKFYNDKTDEIGIHKLQHRLNDLLMEAMHKVETNREELRRLNKALEEFGDLEPTNGALKRKIDDLKKSRLSLEMTFSEEQSTP